MALTTKASQLGFVGWAAESAFASIAANTYTVRHQIRDDMINLEGLARPLVDRGGTFQYLHQADFDVPGPFGADGRFSFSIDAYGHGSATTGALTQTNLSKLLAHVFGTDDWTQVGGLLTTGTNDANTLTSTNTTLLTGGLVRVGALGDGRAEGQASVLLDATSAYELGVDLPAAPTTADSVRAMGLVYPISNPSSALLTSSGAAFNNTLRFVLCSANLAFVARGCACVSVTLEPLGPEGVPRWTFSFAAACWEPIGSVTFPSTTATADKAPSPCTAGSLHIQAKATTTRATYEVREFAIDFDHQLAPIFGPGGLTDGQNVIGWCRKPSKPKITLAFQAEAQTATPTWWQLFKTDPNSVTAREILYTANPIDGRALAIYAPNAKPCGVVPSQGSIDGMNYVRAAFQAMTNTDTTNELTLSPWRIGLG
jgi:hypothetical protein